MRWQILERHRKIMDEYLLFFCSFDDNGLEKVLSNSVNERFKQIQDKAIMGIDVNLYDWVFEVFHPSVFAEMLKEERPFISRIILDCLREKVKALIELYLPPETLVQIRSVIPRPEYNHIFYPVFLRDAMREINIEKFINYANGSEVISKLLKMEYEMINSVVKKAGRFAVEMERMKGALNQVKNYMESGLFILSSLLSDCEKDIYEMFLLKFTPDIRAFIRNIIQSKGEIKWERQRSEEIVERILSSA